MNKTKKSYSIPLYLTVAFVEGAAVMAAELLGAKMVAPFFGTTIYSWAAVLAITLFALASGYYAGGMMTKKYKPSNILTVILIASGALMILMPFIGSGIMGALIDSSILTGLLISLMIFIFPPIFFFGMVSPAIIHALVNDLDKTGSTAGRVYAISTIGGVLNTLLLGFWVIPEYGIKMPAIIYGVMVMLLPLLVYAGKRKPLILIGLLLVSAIAISSGMKEEKSYSQRFRVLYSSEGLLGQVKVVDVQGMQLNGQAMTPRGLIVNNTWQTFYNKSDKTNLLDYVYYINPLLSRYANDDKSALLVGLGGGMLAREITNQNIDLEVVEIDGRLKKLSHRYFDLDPAIPIIIDDGRHYIEKTDKKYDLIILDAFLGENAPWHLLTSECFETIKNKLNPDGSLIIEFFGFSSGKNGLGTRSVYKTLTETGFDVDMVGTRLDTEKDRNIIFIANNSPYDYKELQYDSLKYSANQIQSLEPFLLSFSDQELMDAEFLTDDLPALETMIGNPALQWRRDLNKVLRNLLLEDDLPIFY